MAMSSQGAMDPAATPEGKLPHFEVAKALAFKQCLDAIEEHTKKTCWELTGMSKKDFTAKQLIKMGRKKGQTATGRAVQKHWTK